MTIFVQFRSTVSEESFCVFCVSQLRDSRIKNIDFMTGRRHIQAVYLDCKTKVTREDAEGMCAQFQRNFGDKLAKVEIYEDGQRPY